MAARTILTLYDIELMDIRIELENGATISVPEVKWVSGIAEDYIGMETLNDGFVFLDDMSAPIKSIVMNINKWRSEDGK